MTASHRRRAFGFMAMALAAVALASHAAGPVRLRLGEGDRYLFRHTLATETDVEIPFPQTTKQTMWYTLEQRVSEVDAETGDATIEVRFRRVVVKVDMGEMGGFDVDTEDGESEQSVTYRKLIDRPFTMRISPRGKVIEVNGLTDIVEDVLEADGVNALSLEQVESIVGDESMTGMYQSFLPIYPEDAVDEWETESTITLPMVGAAAVSMLWTFGPPREIDGQTTIPMSATSEITSPSEPTTTSLGFAEMELRLEKMTSEGVIDISADDGWPVKGEIKSDGAMSMKLTIPGLATPTASDMAVRSVSVIERLELPADE
ncbi:hypothetical protein HN371_25510 [Candidatus Poribacteria bacterium]|jgi:hypothetical protein|nr:hypothetical protein [Candidatus Poribacteria bacterium]MBT5532551.1 hypothetical protein [Candidatus Poribacteria bacterium]MBT5710005.1 hypothetical protein [Candidatus Poribacteria bacterium]MBT7096732.1 hypothetical protein [Candidatus Poribacteria bacterium]MBT7809118.1 hypothetical protein [Candidatus Poribacteria bacterium]